MNRCCIGERNILNGNFDDIEMTSRKSAVIQERMYLVSNHMYKQFAEYQKSNANTAVIMDKMAEYAKLAAEYFKQSFRRLGIPVQNIYYEYNKQNHVLFFNILWQAVTFAANMKDTPKALERADKSEPYSITGRITAVKGLIKELSNGFNSETEQKLLEMETASLFVPADNTAKTIMKIRHLNGQEFLISQNEAPREFLLRVIEMVCGGGNYHSEPSRVTFSI